MTRTGRIAGTLGLGLLALDGSLFGQAPPPPPPPPPAGSLGNAFPRLSPADQARWQAGLNAFVRPATVAGGLGPVFNENSCLTCHGGPGGVAGSSGPRLVTRFGRYFNGIYDPMVAFGGPTLQDRGIGKFNGVNFVGEVVPAQATLNIKHRTTPLFGLGLVDAVADQTLEQLSAEQHQASPATAGRPNYVFDPASGQARVGRFGWKAQEPTLFSFAADALVNEMGVSNPVFPRENCPQGNCASLAADPANSGPNVPNDQLIGQLADFMTLTAPPPTVNLTPTAVAGKALFGAIGCGNCHQPSLTTVPSSFAPIGDAVFFPYSDFLIHDMGSLGDGTSQGSSGPTEMRTAPLWGLRFEKSFLHDGRAATIPAAILAHAGQGQASARAFAGLNAAQQAQVLAFLNSL